MRGTDQAYWLADKIPAYGDYAKEAAFVLRRQADEIERLHTLLSECAPHVFSAAEAEHLLDGFRPQRRPMDDLADRLRAALGANVEPTGAAPKDKETP